MLLTLLSVSELHRQLLLKQAFLKGDVLIPNRIIIGYATSGVSSLHLELTFTISGDSDAFEPTGRCHEVAGVGPVAIPFAFRATFSPSGSNKRIQLLAHDDF